jgi:SAM-dependent methyltransferase
LGRRWPFGSVDGKTFDCAAVLALSDHFQRRPVATLLFLNEPRSRDPVAADVFHEHLPRFVGYQHAVRSNVYSDQIFMKSFRVPAGAALFILLQRTQYQRLQKSLLVRLLSRIPYPGVPRRFRALTIEARIRAHQIQLSYFEDVENDYLSLKPYLPLDAKNIMDIGCGIGGVDVFLYQHYAASHPHLYLVDRSELDEGIYYLFQDKGAFYNSLRLTRDFVTMNGVADESVTTLDVGPTCELPATQKLDLVISLISWGFHYPVEIYLEQLIPRLAAGALVILDVRKETTGEQLLRSRFRQVDTIAEDSKKFRFALSSPRSMAPL